VLAELARRECPGVSTVVVKGRRSFAQDRLNRGADLYRA
jgi:hypothetical protein